MIVWSFGDSWAEGFGLQEQEKRFGDYIAEIYNVQHFNKGRSGYSLGNILQTFTANITKIKKEDIVIFIIPPDIRWYSMKGNDFIPLFVGMKEYSQFVRNKNALWFVYHHSMFMYNIIKLCEDIGCQFVLAHNYGVLNIDSNFKNLIPKKYFLDYNKCLTELLGAEPWKNNYSNKLNQDGPPGFIKGKYFIPEDTHPNTMGHKIIADLIIEKLNNV